MIARTEQLDAYRAAEQSHQANADLLTGWQWIATLGPRTCRSCVAMHGSIHGLDEPGPLDHQQGRCARMPLTKSWDELGFPGAQEPSRTINPGDGEKWLAGQPDDVQRHILGVNGQKQWQDGNWPSSEWSERRETDGWRDSFGAATPPKTPTGGGGGSAEPPAGLPRATPPTPRWVKSPVLIGLRTPASSEIGH